MKIRIFLYIIVLLLSSCSLPKNNEIQLREDWITKWIDNPVCSPPCFENITPGLSSIDDAYSLISNDPTNIDVKLDNVELFENDYILLTWARKNYEGHMYFPGVISTGINTNRIVRRISLRNFSAMESTSVYLNDLVQNYGEPQYYMYYYEQSACVYGLVFSDYGMIAIINIVPFGSKVNIESITKVDNLEFLPLSYMEEKNYGLPFEIRENITWHGYGEYLCK